MIAGILEMIGAKFAQHSTASAQSLPSHRKSQVHYLAKNHSQQSIVEQKELPAIFYDRTEHGREIRSKFQQIKVGAIGQCVRLCVPWINSHNPQQDNRKQPAEAPWLGSAWARPRPGLDPACMAKKTQRGMARPGPARLSPSCPALPSRFKVQARKTR